MRPGIGVIVLVAAACVDNAPVVVVDGGVTCTASSQCDDRIPCTTDVCAVGGMCQHVTDSSMCASGQTCDVTRGCIVPGSTMCMRPADCDDHIACTSDTCLVGGTCSHVTRDDMCPGQRCDASRGCTSMAAGTCATAADCNDTFDCTDDICQSNGMCSHVAQNARCGTGRRCIAGMGCIADHPCSTNADCDDHMACNGTETCSELACSAGTPMNCDDGMPCTVDACAEGTPPTCTHMMNPTCSGTTVRSGIYDLDMMLAYMCTGLGMPVVNYSFRVMQFVVTGSTMTVNGAPTSMTGSVPDAAGHFRVSGSIAGDCTETYTLEGMFTSSTHFTGTFSQSYAGAVCGITDCVNRSWMVGGMAR